MDAVSAALEDVDLVAVSAIAAATVLWLIGLLVFHLLRRPTEPATGPPTLDLGPEPPAVANFLVHDFRPTRDAVPATLLDLAARGFVELEHRGPETFVCRLRSWPEATVTAYERRVLEHLRKRESGGIVPSEALTTGPAAESKRWWRAFAGEVIADSKRRGLSEDMFDKTSFTVLAAAAAIPALLVGLLFEHEIGFGYWLAAVGLMEVVRQRHPQRDTPAGLAAASRWLGVRAKLAEDEVFGTQSPIAVALWDRHLAYGAALGVAGGTVHQLPMGKESDRDAWSSYGGRWRPVRVKYGRPFSPGWGENPVVVALVALAPAAMATFLLYVLGPVAADLRDETGLASLIAAGIVLVPALVLVGAAIVIARAVSDLWSVREVTGQIIRLRTFGPKSEPVKQRHYLAVDDGRSRTIRAWRARPQLLARLSQYDLVTVCVTRRLGYVSSITTVGPERSSAAEPGLARLSS